jgi:thioester reductase-like protein
MNYLAEASRIAKDLKEVVFVGSIAVFAHIGAHRKTSDIDFAIASTLSDDYLLELGYKNTKNPRKMSGTLQTGSKSIFIEKT